MDTLITVVEVKGRCPVFAVGDSFRLLDGYRLKADQPICMHALASLMPHYNALRVSEPRRWGLCRPGEDAAYLQCLDPYERTGGGTVIFKVERVPSDDET